MLEVFQVTATVYCDLEIPKVQAFLPKMAKQIRGSSTQRHSVGKVELTMPFRLNVGGVILQGARIKQNIDQSKMQPNNQAAQSLLLTLTVVLWQKYSILCNPIKWNSNITLVQMRVVSVQNLIFSNFMSFFMFDFI